MGKGTILCVDDDEGVLRMEEEMLKKMRYEAIVSSDPFKALEIVKQRNDGISLVMIDIVMPGICGNELAKKSTLFHRTLLSF